MFGSIYKVIDRGRKVEGSNLNNNHLDLIRLINLNKIFDINDINIDPISIYK